MAKDKVINIRLTNEEKEEFKTIAKQQDFDNLSNFILWVLRKFKKQLDKD